jgi:hypothetical protein
MDPNIHSTLPVTRVLSSTPITLSDASSMLAAYTEESRTNPSLHPDCELTPHGPKFPQEGSQGTSVVELLRRISRGMAGEQLGSADAILKQIRDRHLELGSRDDYIETLKRPAKEVEVVVIDEPQDSGPGPVLEAVEEPSKRSSTDRRKSKDARKQSGKSTSKSRERSTGSHSADKSKKRKRKRDDDS